MATRFIFKLEPVLKQRQMIEDERQRALAKCLREKHIIESQLRRMQEDISSGKRQMADNLIGRLDVHRLRAHGAAAAYAGFQAQQLAVKLMTVHRQMDVARAALLEAAKARKAIELLRERQQRRWHIEQQRREQRDTDEIGTQAYLRARTYEEVRP